jgi:hypothetical protein
VYQYHQLHHRLKIGVSSWSSMCVPRVNERESTLLVVIINSHYYALDFLWCRSCWYIYHTYIYLFRHFTDIAAQWSVSDLYTLNFDDVAIFAATGWGMLSAPSEAHDSAFLEILFGAPISHASLPRNMPTNASYPLSHELYCWLSVEMFFAFLEPPDFFCV